MKNKTYFEKIEKDYQKAFTYNKELYRNVAVRLNNILFGRVIDFGNGGVINYETEKLEKLICVDIINKNMMLTNNKIDFIYGDFYNIELDIKANCILAQFLLHHLTDDGKSKKSLNKVKSLLEEKGILIIGEIVIPRFLELIQNITKLIIFGILALMRKPGVRFFSQKSLAGLLKQSGFRDIQIRNIAIGRKVIPAPVLFPKLKIPGKLYPFKIILVEARA